MNGSDINLIEEIKTRFNHKTACPYIRYVDANDARHRRRSIGFTTGLIAFLERRTRPFAVTDGKVSLVIKQPALSVRSH
jgi:hypothetical protein